MFTVPNIESAPSFDGQTVDDATDLAIQLFRVVDLLRPLPLVLGVPSAHDRR